MVSDDLVYGICPDCAYAYTEPIDDFSRWLPKGCPRCSSQREPHPVSDTPLPPPPDLIPVSVDEAFFGPKTALYMLLIRGFGYRTGAWTSEPATLVQTGPNQRVLALGDERGGSWRVNYEDIEAAWRLGDRPGHHE